MDPWTPAERDVLDALPTPEAVQAFVDTLRYHGEITCRSPRRVLRDRAAHCFEGAMFAAAAFAHHGRPAWVLDMGAVRDDAHVLAVYRRNGAWGAVAKSNYSGLRFRAPVYRTLRELAMSYFDDYYNPDGERTLRSYTRPLRLTDRRFPGWRISELDLDPVGDHLDALPHVPLLTPEMERELPRVDARLLAAGLLGANPEGLFKPGP